MESPDRGPRCCERSDPATRKGCPVCGKPVCRFCGVFFRGAIGCVACKAATVKPPVMPDIGGPSARPTLYGACGGFAGAAVAGGLWAGVGLATEREFGWGAVFVGVIAGLGVLTGRRTRSFAGGVTALVAAALGMFVGKWLLVAGFMAAGAGRSLSGAEVLFWALVGMWSVLRPFDALWVLLAFAGAWRVAGAWESDAE